MRSFFKPPFHRWGTFLLFLGWILPTLGHAQWWTHGIDSLGIGDAEIYFSADSAMGIALRQAQPLTADRFGIEGKFHWETSHPPGGIYFLVGRDSSGILQLWVAGYSFRTHRIIVGRLAAERHDDHTRLIVQPYGTKAVTIVPMQKRLAIKWSFFPQTGRIQVEVQGVPMEIPWSIPLEAIQQIGVGLENGTVRFSGFRWVQP
ncbi:MAG: hypothetical protein GXO78_10725 [Calditrichaeota bacterium]|nr:hypothetical protein [Calditrichota bacterium]